MKKLANFSLLSVVTIICLIFAEFAVGKIMPYAPKQDERNLSYNHDKDLGWFPKTETSQKFLGSKLINIYHNKEGFRDIDHVPNKNPNIIFLGDSFVWGYDVQQEERFTNHLQKKFKNKFNIYNFGVSGYGTDQEFLLLQRYYDELNPKIVFVIFCVNDYDNNSHNVIYGGYYKPYYVENNDDLELRGVPVPISGNYKMINFNQNNPILSKSHIVKWSAKLYYRLLHNLDKKHHLKDPTYAILEKMNIFLRDKGSKLVVGTIENDEQMIKFLNENNIDHVNLYNDFRFKEKGAHWNQKGHEFVADKIEKYLKQ